MHPIKIYVDLTFYDVKRMQRFHSFEYLWCLFSYLQGNNESITGSFSGQPFPCQSISSSGWNFRQLWKRSPWVQFAQMEQWVPLTGRRNFKICEFKTLEPLFESSRVKIDLHCLANMTFVFQIIPVECTSWVSLQNLVTMVISSAVFLILSANLLGLERVDVSFCFF